MMYSHSATERLPDARREPMDWSRLPKYMLGPVQKFLMKRSLIVYAVCSVIGVLPSFLARFGGMDISYRIQTAGWGIVFPGAGFIATGTLAGTVFGIAIFMICIMLGATLNNLLGMLGFSVYLWGLNIVGSFFMAKEAPPLYTWILNLLILCIYLVRIFGAANKVQKNRVKKHV